MQLKRQSKISIVWFVQDLRLSDNPAVVEAAHLGEVLPVYIFDDCDDSKFKMGGASKIWLHHSLNSLNDSLNKNLNVYFGKTLDIILYLLEKYEVGTVFCNACYEPWNIKRQNDVWQLCEKKSIKYKMFNSSYLWSPHQVLKSDAEYYKVFTAYKNKSYQSIPRQTIKCSVNIKAILDSENKTSVSSLCLIPTEKEWHNKILSSWEVGELEAKKKLHNFIEKNIFGYKDGRDYPVKNQTSLLSPHLHFGEISPAQVFEAVNSHANFYPDDPDREHFLSELIWREFSSYLLYHFKTLHEENFNKKFNNFRWGNNSKHLNAWQKGNTGYPIIDAGMRQLWQTGYMHNRVRMITASFLVKNLNIDWRKGRDWFWDCLVDADLANNSAGWQWVAGCGVDAAPYFRIFNPVIQGEKFDKNGDYTRKFIPELKNIPNKYLFQPWNAPEDVLKSAGVTLGENYPNPIVDLATSRKDALEAYKKL